MKTGSTTTFESQHSDNTLVADGLQLASKKVETNNFELVSAG